MNTGSVQNIATAPLNKVNGAPLSKGKPSNEFSSLLSGMSRQSKVPTASTNNDMLGSTANEAEKVLEAADLDTLAQALEQLVGIPADTILEGIAGLNASSKLSDWMKALGASTEDIMKTLLPLLENVGISKEQLAEIAYSDEVWPLMTAIANSSSEIMGQLKNMLSSNEKLVRQDALNVLALLKGMTTALQTKDLLGWQQNSLTDISTQLNMLQTTLISKEKNTGETFVVVSKLDTVKPGLVPANAVTEDRPATELQRQSSQIVEAVLQNGDKGSNSERKNEQNQVPLIQNLTSQPIVARNVFSLDTAEARPTSQAEALLAKLQGIFKQTNFGQLGGTNRLLVKLYPEHLGQVRIELLQVNGVMTARILASTALGKEMLDSQLHQLRQSFAQQNIQVERIDVSQAVHDPSRSDKGQNFNHQQFKGDGEQADQQERETEDSQSFHEYLIDLEG